MVVIEMSPQSGQGLAWLGEQSQGKESFSEVAALGPNNSHSLSTFFLYKGSKRLHKWIASVSLLLGRLAALEMKISFPLDLSLHFSLFAPPPPIDLNSYSHSVYLVSTLSLLGKI